MNRGFLIGPYCPIYGWGYLAITILLTKYKAHPVALFVLISVVCSVIEYMTSLILEKLFHARWWDYSKRLLNVDGRICITNSVAFGALGIVALMYLNPMTLVLNSIRACLYENNFPSVKVVLALAVVAFVFLWIGFKVFNKLQRRFAEEI